VAPAFDFADLELADKTRLRAQFPLAEAEIEALCP